MAMSMLRAGNTIGAHLAQVLSIALVSEHEGRGNGLHVDAVAEPLLAHRAQPDELVAVRSKQEMLCHGSRHAPLLHGTRFDTLKHQLCSW